MKTFVLRALFYFGLALLWQVVFSLEIWPDYIFPSPLEVAKKVALGFWSQEYLGAIAKSMVRLLIGYLISLVLGLFLGLFLFRWKILDETLGSLILGLQTLPSICWMPLALLWFGLNDRAIIFVIVIGSVLSMTLSTKTAISHVPALWVRAARTMGARGWMLQSRVVFPAAFPALLEGMKQGWSFAWRSLMGGELLFVTFGLGHLMNMGRELNDMGQVVAVMVVIVCLGLITERLVFSVIEQKVVKLWGFKRG